jgi:hypothetical protein
LVDSRKDNRTPAICLEMEIGDESTDDLAARISAWTSALQPLRNHFEILCCRGEGTWSLGSRKLGRLQFSETAINASDRPSHRSIYREAILKEKNCFRLLSATKDCDAFTPGQQRAIPTPFHPSLHLRRTPYAAIRTPLSNPSQSMSC